MKKTITLLSLLIIASFGMSQTVFQSDLSAWDSSGNPSDFFGPVTSISASSVTQVSTGAMHGTSFANIVNATTSHKRITTQPFAVTPNTEYKINMYIAGTAGDIRVRCYDVTNSAYVGSYTAYQSISGTTLTIYSDSVTTPTGCTSMSYIISLRNTPALGIGLDSVSISKIACSVNGFG